MPPTTGFVKITRDAKALSVKGSRRRCARNEPVADIGKDIKAIFQEHTGAFNLSTLRLFCVVSVRNGKGKKKEWKSTLSR